ncbi:MAG: hypothetical protein AB8B94_07320 [Hyphomicrobiales bacterium]
MSSMSFAADPSPQPTTSPTTSGKLQLSKVELSRFVNARSAITESITKFNALVKSGDKSKSQLQELKMLAAEINKQAVNIQRYSQLTNNSKAGKIAAQLILDDDVAGRKVFHSATAKRLSELDAQLALLEPVVHR